MSLNVVPDRSTGNLQWRHNWRKKLFLISKCLPLAYSHRGVGLCMFMRFLFIITDVVIFFKSSSHVVSEGQSSTIEWILTQIFKTFFIELYIFPTHFPSSLLPFHPLPYSHPMLPILCSWNNFFKGNLSLANKTICMLSIWSSNFIRRVFNWRYTFNNRNIKIKRWILFSNLICYSVQNGNCQCWEFLLNSLMYSYKNGWISHSTSIQWSTMQQ